MIVDDFIMLGKTVPEPSSDGRVFVCSAGYSPELRQFIRVYPLARRDAPKRWSVSRVPLERNPKDSRPESWKLAGDRRPGQHQTINAVFSTYDKIKGFEQGEILENAPARVESIAEANQRRLSLAIIKPSYVPTITMEHNAQSPDSPQLRLFDDGLTPQEGARRFPFMPRITFGDTHGTHRLMLRDWGCYELMRKHPEHTHDMDNALSLGSDSMLLVGNLNRHRTSWLVISVLNIASSQMRLEVA